jgi:hypothetical protein
MHFTTIPAWADIERISPNSNYAVRQPTLAIEIVIGVTAIARKNFTIITALRITGAYSDPFTLGQGVALPVARRLTRLNARRRRRVRSTHQFEARDAGTNGA